MFSTVCIGYSYKNQRRPCGRQGLLFFVLKCCADRFRAGSGVAGTYRDTFGGAVAAAVMVIAVVNVTADAVVYILLVNMTAAVVVFIFHFNVLSFLKITIIFYPAYGVTYKKNLALEDEFCLYM